jgi:hypothetical protein
MRIRLNTCQKRLTIVWFIGAGILFTLLILQTIFGRYGDKANEAWSWLLPTITPTLSLIIGGVVVSGHLGKGEKTKTVQTVDQFAYRLSFFLSLAYLIAVSLTFFLSPFSDLPPLELMELSNLWLAPFQGLVSAALGVFFVSQK